MSCIYCGNEQQAELLDIYPLERSFHIGEACCEHFGNALHQDPDLAAKFFAGEIESYTGHKMRGMVPFHGWNMKLQIHPIKQADAKAFVSKHHRHNKPPAGWRYGAGIWNYDTLVGVIMVGRPVARKLDHNTIVEVNRLCIDPSLDRELTKHACSQLYAWAAKQAKKRGFRKVITYTLATEAGISLKAAGWQNEGSAGGGSWNSKSRPRKDTAPTMKKVRWSREVRKAA